jgi:hypothetical protein
MCKAKDSYLQDIDASSEHVGADENLALSLAIVVNDLRQNAKSGAGEPTKGAYGVSLPGRQVAGDEGHLVSFVLHVVRKLLGRVPSLNANGKR